MGLKVFMRFASSACTVLACSAVAAVFRRAVNGRCLLLTQYREPGVLLWRGFSMLQFAHQCFATTGDLGKGRQMPVHYGSKAHRFHTISSPLA